MQEFNFIVFFIENILIITLILYVIISELISNKKEPNKLKIKVAISLAFAGFSILTDAIKLYVFKKYAINLYTINTSLSNKILFFSFNHMSLLFKSIFYITQLIWTISIQSAFIAGKLYKEVEKAVNNFRLGFVINIIFMFFSFYYIKHVLVVDYSENLKNYETMYNLSYFFFKVNFLFLSFLIFTTMPKVGALTFIKYSYFSLLIFNIYEILLAVINKISFLDSYENVNLMIIKHAFLFVASLFISIASKKINKDKHYEHYKKE